MDKFYGNLSEFNIKELEAELAEIDKKLTFSTNKLVDLQSKSIKNKPLQEKLIESNDDFPYFSFEELKKNQKNLIHRDNNEELKSIINQYGEDGNPIIISDLSKLLEQHLTWIENLPFIKPCYAMKCNNDYMIIKTLRELGCGFDCASLEEIKQALEVGASPESIIFAHTIKPPSHLKYAYEKGVNLMTFDNADELVKIKKYHPNAKLVIRIKVDDSKSLIPLGKKFGVEFSQIKNLIEKIVELKMNFVGVSFHVGSCCKDGKSYYQAIKQARKVFDIAKNEYNIELKLLNIGGGFLPDIFKDHARFIKDSIKDHFSDLKDKIKIIAEPGTYYAYHSMNLAIGVIGIRKKESPKLENNLDKKSDYQFEIDKTKSFNYYVSDGIYGTFNIYFYDEVKEYENLVYLIFNEESANYEIYNKEKCKSLTHFFSTVCGPTCVEMDVLTEDYPIPELKIGDWIVFESFGAYTICVGSEFNGFPRPNIFYLSTRISKEVEKEIASFYSNEILEV